MKVFVGSDINNYGKFYTYGAKVNFGVAQGSRLKLSYKTEDRKQKATTMDARFVYDLTSNLGLNLGYKSTETKKWNQCSAFIPESMSRFSLIPETHQ